MGYTHWSGIASVQASLGALSATSAKVTTLSATYLRLKGSFPTFKVSMVKAATGNGAYAVTGLASTDIVMAAPYIKFSGTSGTVTTTGNASLGARGTGSLTFGKIVSFGLVTVYWLDLSQ